MARPKDDAKRAAIIAAATRVIVAEGLSAPTARIAREAGVANGSLFTYFETKAVLVNALYLELKLGMASAALEGVPVKATVRKQFFQSWSNWMRWTLANPEKRRALTILDVSEDITPENRAAAHKAMMGIVELMERARANGPMRDVRLPFLASLMNSLAEATMDFMIQDPDNAEEHSQVGFNALWRMLNY